MPWKTYDEVLALGDGDIRVGMQRYMEQSRPVDATTAIRAERDEALRIERLAHERVAQLEAELAGQRDENVHLCNELHRHQKRAATLEGELATHELIIKGWHDEGGKRLDRIAALEAELAEQTRLVDVWQGKWRHCEEKFKTIQSYGVPAQAEHLSRIAALEAELAAVRRNATEHHKALAAENDVLRAEIARLK